MRFPADDEQINDLIILRELGEPTPCTHWARHTVYRADDPSRNGIWCQACGEKIR